MGRIDCIINLIGAVSLKELCVHLDLTAKHLQVRAWEAFDERAAVWLSWLADALACYRRWLLNGSMTQGGLWLALTKIRAFA